MNLTPAERRALEQYRQYRNVAPTIRQLLLRSIKFYFLLVASIGAMTLLVWVMRMPLMGVLWGGMGLGALLRDCGWFRRSVRNWPTLEKIIDWERVAKLLAEKDGH